MYARVAGKKEGDGGGEEERVYLSTRDGWRSEGEEFADNMAQAWEWRTLAKVWNEACLE